MWQPLEIIVWDLFLPKKGGFQKANLQFVFKHAHLQQFRGVASGKWWDSPNLRGFPWSSLVSLAAAPSMATEQQQQQQQQPPQPQQQQQQQQQKTQPTQNTEYEHDCVPKTSHIHTLTQLDQRRTLSFLFAQQVPAERPLAFEAIPMGCMGYGKYFNHQLWKFVNI